jgi:histidine triad (HIT) family protein
MHHLPGWEDRIRGSGLEKEKPGAAMLERMARKTMRALGPVSGWVFAHMSFAIPIQRLRETERLMAFHHPKPAYPFHVLIVPKKAIAGLLQLDKEDSGLLSEVMETAQSIIQEYKLSGYRLVLNGGEYQDIPQLHFHLISDTSPENKPPI